MPSKSIPQPCHTDYRSPRKREKNIEPLWWITKDGDRSCRELYQRHYSCRATSRRRLPSLFVGPGEKLVLRTSKADALFVWRRFIDDSGQTGVNCAVFRNESAHRSSDLIRQADAIADCVWPGRRHYTYVNPSRVRSRNPGFCFLVAGWRRCGNTQGGLLILERCPGARVSGDAYTPPVSDFSEAVHA